MTVAVLVPLRLEDDWRTRAWAHVRAHYETHHPEWRIITGSVPEGEIWARGAAINNAATLSTADRFVIADADNIVDPGTLNQAVELLDTHPWIVPFDEIRRLSRYSTNQVCDGAALAHDLELDRKAYRPGGNNIGTTAGGIVAVRRNAFEAVNGHDPRFQGWGGEEYAFGWALETLVGPHDRLDTDLWHLWHPWKNRKKWQNGGLALRRRYRDAFGHVQLMRPLVNEH